MAWQPTVEWWTAVEAAMKCQGFIGHLGSAATKAMYRLMCFHHYRSYLECPPLYTFDHRST
jgi:hypothetical protein